MLCLSVARLVLLELPVQDFQLIVSDDGMSVLEPLFGSREAVELLLSTDVSGDREEKEGVA